MSFLPSIRATSRQAIRTNFAPVATFRSSAIRTLKEDDTNRDDLTIHYESHKQENLKSTKEGRGKWKAELASNSEADVKADRGEVDSDITFEELQKKTKHVGKQ